MSTKAEQYKTNQEREAAKAHVEEERTSRSKPGAPPGEKTREKLHAGRKATYALEAPVEGRPSRKSTRKSANRSKPDTNLTLRATRQAVAADARARRGK